MDLVCRYSGNLAHELNNLLTPIVVCTQMLKEDVHDPEAVLFNAEQIAEAGNRIQALARKMIVIGSRQNAGGMVFPAVALSRAMKRAVLPEDHPPQLIEAFSARAGTHEWAVTINPEQFDFMADELVRNAVEASTNGGQIVLDVEPDESAGVLMITIKDQGVGITAEALPHVFEPFFTTRSNTRERGLGLTMVYGIVRRAGGSIRCESRPGEGTIFLVTLPMCPRVD